MKKIRYLFVAIAVAILIVIGCIVIIPKVEIDVVSEGEHTFIVDETMPRVRKILVRTNAVKKILAMADVEVVDQKWLKMHFDIDRPLRDRDWKLDGTGSVKVKANDAYLGGRQLTLTQVIEIEADRLSAVSELLNPVGPLHDYHSDVLLTPDKDGRAKIDLKLNLQVKTKVNWLFRGTIEEKIRDSAEQALKDQEQAFRDVIAEHEDKLIILPDAN